MPDQTPATTEVPDDGRVAVTIDGRETRAVKGSLVLDAATDVGVHIPIYCAHPKMDPVAVCRMCLVHVEKMPKLQPACATVVSEGMVVTTDTAQVAKMREGVLEFLLINHPLDCPVCDRGGECDLQDFSFRYGPQTSRFPITEKVHAAKAVSLSDKIELDQERCILCWRCVRYYEEITGEKEIVLMQRGVRTVVDTFNGEALSSDFQGNLPEVCPVGALTHKQYRFKARPWDLQRTKSICPECSYGCNINADSRDFEIKRFASRDNPDVDDMWLCDRGRYSATSWNGGERLRRAIVRDGSDERDVTVTDAVAAVVSQLSDVREKHGAASIGFIASPGATNEELWLLQRLAREVLGTNNVDHGLDTPRDLAPDEHALGIAEIEDCSTVVVLGPEPERNAPVLTLRLFKAGHKHNVDVRRVAADVDANSLDIKGGALVGVIADESNRDNAARVASALARNNTTVRRLTITRGVNGRGAKDVGFSPDHGPGYATAAQGLGGRDILEGAAAGSVKALVFFGAATVLDEEKELAERAVKRADVVIVMDSRPSVASAAATVLIPGHSYFEKQGSVTNVEGRVQRIRAALPPATAMPQETRVITMIAKGLGATEWGNGDPVAVHQELVASLAAYAGVGNGGRATWTPVGAQK